MQDVTIYSWYCPNCRSEVAGYKNKKNQIKVKCRICGVEMTRTLKTRRRDVIDIIAPEGEERSGV